MIALLADILVFAILVSLLALASARLVGRAAGRNATGRVSAAEHIARTRRAPGDWVDARVGAGRLEERARAALVRRLEQLISYMRTAPVFEDASARALLLGELERARADWLTLPLASIVPEADGQDAPPPPRG